MREPTPYMLLAVIALTVAAYAVLSRCIVEWVWCRW